MTEILMGLSSDLLYFNNKKTEKISKYHSPYFLAFTNNKIDIHKARNKLFDQWKKNSSEHEIFSKIKDIGEIQQYKSFSNFEENRQIFKIYTKESYFVPEISDYLFFNYDFFTAEHDIPYHQRALIDLAADEKFWIFDTNGKNERLKTLIYDIETTQFIEGKKDIPIDIIGYSDFDIKFQSSKDIASEQFSFDIIDLPSAYQDLEVKQLVSRNIDEEIQNLIKFCKIAQEYDIISGHNILGFDNEQVYGRINSLLKNNKDKLSNDETKLLYNFIQHNFKQDKSFHFGVGSEIVQFYPCSFDTYIASRKFYSFLDDFSLKALAPFLGIEIKNRLYLTPSQIKIDNRTLKYNKQDVQEQIGVTLNLIQQALPLAFNTCMPFDMLLPSGAVNIWDHMSLLRGAMQKKIMPPICRVKSISQTLTYQFKNCDTKEKIMKEAKSKGEQLSKEFVRIIKYGDEMPDWVEYPYIIYNQHAKDSDDSLSYHMPGGMTIKPDKDANSHFIPWYYVVVADVGAMYPTILKAMNIGADTVKIAKKSEKPDAWIWLKKIPTKLFEDKDVLWRQITDSDSFADKGHMIGVRIDKNPGVVNEAMTGILNMIAKIKNELKQAKLKNNKSEINRLKMMYQSLKGARNAGTHGILAAPTVTGRQFNLWGATAITTKGQMILADTINYLQKNNIRVVYGDTDGIYLGCSRSIGNIPNLSKNLGLSLEKDESKWLSKPQNSIDAIEKCNHKWQNELNYPDFELEPEIHDAMIFVKHKNYLIFDSKDDHIDLITKGNNFKGSDKANIARKVLYEIMIKVLKENPEWNSEDDVRNSVKNSIKSITKEIVSNLDLSKVDLDDLTLVQSVQPAKRYKLNQDGSISTFGRRAQALEKLIGQPIKSRIKLKFVVTKKPLPGITKPSKSGVKPIDYMYPIDHLKNTNEIDLEWYKKMVENYIQGAFGLSDISTTEQVGLDAWM